MRPFPGLIPNRAREQAAVLFETKAFSYMERSAHWQPVPGMAGIVRPTELGRRILFQIRRSLS